MVPHRKYLRSEKIDLKYKSLIYGVVKKFDNQVHAITWFQKNDDDAQSGNTNVFVQLRERTQTHQAHYFPVWSFTLN